MKFQENIANKEEVLKMTKTVQMYEGKAKKVFATDDENYCIVDYKDDATAMNGLKKGTIMGKVVLAAIAPAKWAAFPAAAMMTPKLFSLAFTAKSLAWIGVLCAE